MRPDRGKRVDGKGWVYGYHFRAGRSHFIISLHCVLQEIYPSPFIRDFVEVIPDSVGQSIGLKDMKKKEGFRGDLVKYGNEVYEIIWNDLFGSAYLAHRKGSKICTGLDIVHLKDAEVIGNATDDPELLKGGGERWKQLR